MPQKLRALAALAEDLGWIPSTQVVAHNCMELQFHGMSCILWTSVWTCTDKMHIQILVHTHAYHRLGDYRQSI